MYNNTFMITVLCFMISGFVHGMDVSPEQLLLEACQMKLTPWNGHKMKAKVDSLLLNKVDAAVQDERGMTPLMHTLDKHSSYDPFRIFTSALKWSNADVGINKQDNKGNTALMYLCRNGGLFESFPHFFQILFDLGADVTIKNHEGETALGMLNISPRREKEILNRCDERRQGIFVDVWNKK